MSTGRRDVQAKRRRAKRRRTRGYPYGPRFRAYFRALGDRFVDAYGDELNRLFWRSEPGTSNPMVGLDGDWPDKPPRPLFSGKAWVD